MMRVEKFLLICVALQATLFLPATLAESDTITPTETIRLFNGKDLNHFYTWLVDRGYSDPKRVFSVVDEIDGVPAIRISGEEWGGLITSQAYRDYKLLVEFRWGLTTWGGRKGAARDSGILIHCQGTDGNTKKDFNGPWMRSLETQVIEGGVGDFIPVFGYDDGSHLVGPAYTASVSQDPRGNVIYDAAGREKRFERGRVNWFGHDPDWVDVAGFRGKEDVESPLGEWTTIEVVCDGSAVRNIVNGVLVNAVSDCTFSQGKILFQSEGAELYLRRIELQPLD